MNHEVEARASGRVCRQKAGEGASSFAEVVDGRLVELRRELVREACWWLRQFERHRDDESRGRLLATLEHLALLVHA